MRTCLFSWLSASLALDEDDFSLLIEEEADDEEEEEILLAADTAFTTFFLRFMFPLSFSLDTLSFFSVFETTVEMLLCDEWEASALELAFDEEEEEEDDIEELFTGVITVAEDEEDDTEEAEANELLLEEF